MYFEQIIFFGPTTIFLHFTKIYGTLYLSGPGSRLDQATADVHIRSWEWMMGMRDSYPLLMNA